MAQYLDENGNPLPEGQAPQYLDANGNLSGKGKPKSSQPTDPTALANQVLASKGIRVGAPPFSARQDPSAVTDKFVIPQARGVGNVPSPGSVATDSSANPTTRALISTGANMPTPAELGKGLLMAGPAGQAISGIRQSAQNIAQPPNANQSLDQVASQLGVNPQSVKENASNQDYPGLFGNVAAPILTLGMMKGAAAQLPIGSPTGQGLGNLPPEVQARMIARAVNPAEGEWNSYIQNISKEGGNIVAAAKQKGMPLETNQHYADAAKSAAEDAHQTYKSQILDPVANDSVTVGENFNGRKLQVGNSTQYQTTIGELEKRLDGINDELRSSYVKKETGQTLTAIEKSGLEAEQKALSSQLYKELSDRTGMPPDQIQALRQRYGRLYQIADQTQAAVNAREKLVSGREEGRDVPKSIQESIFRGINNLRGGPMGNADRYLRSALGKTSLPSSPLPNAVASPLKYDIGQNPLRTPLSQQVNTSGMDMTTFQPNSPNAGQAVQQNLSVRRAANQLDQVRAQNSITSQHESLVSQQAARDAVRKQRIADLLKNNPATEIGYNTGQ